MKRFIVTIDGPAGAGKTTVSRRLAERLGFRYIDTGALYRGVAYEVRAAGIEPDDDEALARLCRKLRIELVQTGSGLRLFSNGVDITDKIRTPEISMLASAVSARGVVRGFLMQLQRSFGRGRIVIEGRDMGTVVFPDAQVKFFLDASPEVRARRRYLDLKDTSGQNLEGVRQDMLNRDRSDSSRTLSPLKPAADATIVDSTDRSIEEIVDHMADLIAKKKITNSKHQIPNNIQ
jgi:cytidylate kinase